MSDLLKVTIDGKSIEVAAGTTILQAARMIGGKYPPAMCYYSSIKETGESVESVWLKFHNPVKQIPDLCLN